MPTDEVISILAKSETGQIGEGPVQGGAAATAQSMLDKQKNLAAKFTQVNNKPPEAITQKDAAEMHSKQDRVLGTDARTPSGLAAQVQSQANHNDIKKMEDRSNN